MIYLKDSGLFLLLQWQISFEVCISWKKLHFGNNMNYIWRTGLRWGSTFFIFPAGSSTMPLCRTFNLCVDSSYFCQTYPDHPWDIAERMQFYIRHCFLFVPSWNKYLVFIQRGIRPYVIAKREEPTKNQITQPLIIFQRIVVLVNPICHF